jgi:glutamate-5-semialdehyde dehydrogenase
MGAEIEAVARRARAASLLMKTCSAEERDAALRAIRVELARHETRRAVLESNAKDKAIASEKSSAVPAALLKRLELGGSKYDGLLEGISQVVTLSDPVGVVQMRRLLDQGLELTRVSCPIGVLCVVFEARPEAAIQIASLAIKSGNALILKGGREARRSNEALVGAVRTALAKLWAERGERGVPADTIQLVHERAEVKALLALDSLIDLVVPRGSNALVRTIKEHTRIPVLGHADGICSVYLDASADPLKAERIVVDAKTSYPAACNAAETLLVHRSLVQGSGDASCGAFLRTAHALLRAGVSLRVDTACEHALGLAPWRETLPEGSGGVSRAMAEDFHTEFLGLTMAVKTVDNVAEAAAHINANGSGHTDCIVTEDAKVAEAFVRAVDTAGAYVNASTRFADGFRYGFGAEVGISTNKIHARGPVGVDGLLTYRYVLRGEGRADAHCSVDYGGGEQKRQYLHQDLPVEGRSAWWSQWVKGTVLPCAVTAAFVAALLRRQ